MDWKKAVKIYLLICGFVILIFLFGISALVNSNEQGLTKNIIIWLPNGSNVTHTFLLDTEFQYSNRSSGDIVINLTNCTNPIPPISPYPPIE